MKAVKRTTTALLLYAIIFFSSCQKEINIAASDLKTLGSSAHDLLSAERYTSLIVEIDYMPGFKPDDSCIRHFTSFLNAYLNKPDGIQVVLHAIPSSGKTAMSVSELVQLEKQSRSAFTLGSTLAAYILISDASFITDTATLAISYWNTSACLFGKSILQASGMQGQINSMEQITTLLEHEFGHLLGLVDQGSPMQEDHKDVVNGAHCIDPKCLMYYAIELAEFTELNNSIPMLDLKCQSDLKANGGK